MQHDYLNNWASIVHQMQRPMQAFAQLNAETLQNMRYLKPEDFSNLQRPEELIEKQLAIFVENGHKTLDYWQKTFAIFEDGLKSFSKEAKNIKDKVSERA